MVGFCPDAPVEKLLGLLKRAERPAPLVQHLVPDPAFLSDRKNTVREPKIFNPLKLYGAIKKILKDISNQSKMSIKFYTYY